MSTFYNEHLDAERELGRAQGRMAERSRLRPLLERCLCVVSSKSQIAADLRRELGKEG